MMDEARLDALLDATLESGEVPAGATAEEREELLAMLASASALRRASGEVDAELTAALPIAGARFERFLAANQPVLAAARPQRTSRGPGFVARLFRRGPFGAVAWSAAVVALLAAGGFMATAVLFTGAGTAQAFEPGDYVELEGVVSDAPGAGRSHGFTVASEFNDVKVDIAQDTSISDADDAAGEPAITQGTSVTVAGVVDKSGHVVARSVAVSRKPQARPLRITFKELREQRPDLTGKVVTFALSQDGTKGRVLLASASGERLIVNVDGKSLAQLLSLTRGLGARVRVTQDAGQAGDVFSLSAIEAPPATATLTGVPSAPSPAGTPPARRTPSATAKPASARLAGVVAGRDANVLTVVTRDGPRQVVLSRETRILLGDSGLLRERILSGAESVIGHGVSVSGSLVKATGRLTADVLIVGPKAPR